MTENNFDTIYLARKAESCEDKNDLQEILRCYDQYYLSWQKFINNALDESGLSYNSFAQCCGISKNTLKKWCVCGGAPRSRATYIKIGFGLNMTEDEINQLLIRYGGYHGLYAKDLFDAACLFTLRKRGAYEDAISLYQRCSESEPGEPSEAETILLRGKMQQLDTEDSFVEFVQQNQELFTAQNAKLSQYIRDFLHMRQWELAIIEGRSFSLHAWALAVGLPPRFEKLLSNLYLHGAIPRREQLIALGLHLDMTPDSLNTMLQLAHMEGLCARNRLECVLIYVLQKIDLLHPDISFSNAQQLLQITQDPSLKDACIGIIRDYLENSYHSAEDDIYSVAETVNKLLCELNLEEAEELLELI